ncbi:MAG: peptidoglycan-binding protein, partial [Actinomycetota bacterium]|nr:peptidoglycan-binding protein [Actinomycetota bacterium]
IQGVHDYEQCRYWKSYDGWNTATASASSGFGESWAQWLHIERTWAAANDGRSIAAALGHSGGGGGKGGGGKTGGGGGKADTATVIPQPVIRRGDEGANVARLQDFLRQFEFADFATSDGVYGPKTLKAVKSAQTSFEKRGWYTRSIDGEYGPGTAAAAAKCLDAGKG